MEDRPGYLAVTGMSAEEFELAFKAWRQMRKEIGLSFRDAIWLTTGSNVVITLLPDGWEEDGSGI